MLIDAFTFYNELDMLEYRLTLLYDVVDYFIIVEATKTHSGSNKILYYNENIERFNKFKNKIIHIIVDDLSSEPNTNWSNEKYQRNCISKGFNNLNDDDLIIISDVDEIPDPNVLKLLIVNEPFHLVTFKMDLYYYNLNHYVSKWYGAKCISYRFYKEYNSCDEIRFIKFGNFVKCGWHLSYFGNSDFIKNKIKHFAHQEFNNENILNSIDHKLVNGLCPHSSTKLTFIKLVDNHYLPINYELFCKLSNTVVI